MKFYLFLLCLAVFFSSCTMNVRDKVIRHADSGCCEQAIAVFEKNAIQEKIWQKAKMISGTTISGTMTGAVLVTETTIYVVPGVAMGVIICSPIIALEASSHSHGYNSGQCVAMVTAEITEKIVPQKELWLSSKIWEKTQTWRIESYDKLSEMLRNIAQCYAARAMPDDLMTAEMQLLSIKESIWEKLSTEEQNRVNLLLIEIQSRRTTNTSADCQQHDGGAETDTGS